MRRLMSFFFQAEDGIRDLTVTGVQTCALPISQGNSVLNKENQRTPLYIRTLFPCVIALGACFLSTTSALAQSSESDPRSTSATIRTNGSTELANEPLEPNATEESRPRSVSLKTTSRIATVAPSI